MCFQRVSTGMPSEDFARTVHDAWAAAAAAAGVDLAGFDPASALAERINWARAAGLEIATVYGRSSSRASHDSVADQVLPCVAFAAGRRMYAPPELVAVDQSVGKRGVRRAGFARMQEILRSGTAQVLLVHRFSRLCRSFFAGCAMIDKIVAQTGARAIDVTHGLDMRDDMKWNMLLAIESMCHGGWRRYRS